MYNTLSNGIQKPRKIINLFIQTRFLSAKEISTALRQFYFNVHPDLFGKYPEQRNTNENSLKQLSSYIEKVQTSKSFQPCTIQFYLRDLKGSGNEKFRLVSISLKEQNIRSTILDILKTCNLSTQYIDDIPQKPDPQRPSPRPPFQDQQETYAEEYDIFNIVRVKKRIEKAKKLMTLRTFIQKNYKSALEKYAETALLRKDIESICNEIYDRFQPKDIKWDCGWDEKHYRGCLLSFTALANDHPENMSILKNRILVFASFTGVSLDGHIMLNSGEVRHNWLDFLKNIKKHDNALSRIPHFEKAVSQVLRDIRVERRKFMFKILAQNYENDLRLIMTTLNDYSGTKGYPKSWPESLRNYEIVVETAAGPLMVSPTGQFIVPSSCPGFLLVHFFTENFETAARKMIEYNAHKHIESFLHALCAKELKLASLRKDDNVTPELMIKCCETLLEHKSELVFLEKLQLNISTYYSLMNDGVVCIPWNFKI